MISVKETLTDVNVQDSYVYNNSLPNYVSLELKDNSNYY